jgi:hypothetical protein
MTMIDPKTTTFYRCTDGTLARVRDDGRAIPEVYGPEERGWFDYPELDIWHDANVVTVADIVSWRLAPQEDLYLDGRGTEPVPK